MRIRIVLVTVGCILATSGCSSSDNACAAAHLVLSQTDLHAGDPVNVGAEGLKPCSDGDGPAPSTVPQNTKEISIAIAKGEHPSSIQIPVQTIAVDPWITASVDVSSGQVTGSGSIPASLAPGRYFLFAVRYPDFGSNSFLVGE